MKHIRVRSTSVLWLAGWLLLVPVPLMVSGHSVSWRVFGWGVFIAGVAYWADNFRRDGRI